MKRRKMRSIERNRMSWLCRLLTIWVCCIRQAQALTSTESPSPSLQPSTMKQNSNLLNFNIILELRGEDFMNMTEISAFKEATYETIKDPTCESKNLEVISIEFSEQSLSTRKTVLFVDFELYVKVDINDHLDAQRQITECLQSNAVSLKNNYQKSIGIIDTSEVGEKKSINELKIIIIAGIVVGSAVLLFVVFIFIFCLVERRKRNEAKSLKSLQLYGGEDIPPDQTDDYPVSIDSEVADAELGGIEHLMSMVMEGPSGQSDSTSSTVVTNELKMKPTISTNGYESDHIELESIGYIKKTNSVMEKPVVVSPVRRSKGATSHSMHSEGLTFQPIVENEVARNHAQHIVGNEVARDRAKPDSRKQSDTAEIVNHEESSDLSSVDYVKDVQKMVLESQMFFDPNENDTQDSSCCDISRSTSASKSTKGVTHFNKRMMHHHSPTKGLRQDGYSHSPKKDRRQDRLSLSPRKNRHQGRHSLSPKKDSRQNRLGISPKRDRRQDRHSQSPKTGPRRDRYSVSPKIGSRNDMYTMRSEI